MENRSKYGEIIKGVGVKFNHKPMKKMTKGVKKVAKTMGEFKKRTLHSGSKKGPKVTSKKQAVAIALNQKRKAVNKGKKAFKTYS